MSTRRLSTDFRLEQAIQEVLRKKTAIALPDDFMKAWLQGKNKVPKEQIEMYYQQYTKVLRWRLLVEALSQKHGLGATYDEVVTEVRHQLQANLEHGQVVQPSSEENMEMIVQSFLRENDGAHYRKVQSVYICVRLLTLSIWNLIAHCARQMAVLSIAIKISSGR